MKLKLRFTAQLKDLAGLGTDEITLNENEKLQSSLKIIAERYGEQFTHVLFDENGNYRNSNLIIINQDQVNYDENSALNDGDELTLMSPIAGG